MHTSMIQLLESQNIDIENRIYNHTPVKTMEDVYKVLSTDASNMIKSLVICIKYNSNILCNSDMKKYILIAIPSNKKIDFKKLSDVLQVPRRLLEMANKDEIQDVTGFEVGSIPPFGLPKNIPIIFDESLKNKTEIWCGTGISTQSIRLYFYELIKLSSPKFSDISKN